MQTFKYFLKLTANKVLPFWLACVCLSTVQAQDPHFSQYYAAKLYHNVAFAGTAGQHRICAQYRNQWPGLVGNYTTFSASYDTPLGKTNHSIGAYALTNQAGTSNLRSTGIHGAYAYKLQLTDQLTLRTGLSLGYVTRNLDYYKLTFADQFAADGTYNGATNEALGGFSIGFADIGAGALLYGKKYWFALSGTHLNVPKQNWHQQAERLPIRLVAMGGYNFPFGRNVMISPREGYAQIGQITPTFAYKHQGAFDQLDVGLYVEYNGLVAGMWYRGLPILSVAEGVYNHDALVFMAGFRSGTISFGYSYDYSLSQMRFAAGSHEISICVGFSKPVPYNGLPCPDI